MIKVLTGEDRLRIQEEISKELGENYETFDGEALAREDLTEIFQGVTLFFSGEGRRILIRDLSENKEVFAQLVDKIEDFSKTEAKVILLEMKLDKRLAAIKKLVKSGVEIKEFKVVEKENPRAIFEIYKTALRDGKRAVEELKKIQIKQDPYMFFGLMVSQALRQFGERPNGRKEKAILKELGKTDIKMKSTTFEPWTLIEGCLVKLSSL